MRAATRTVSKTGVDGASGTAQGGLMTPRQLTAIENPCATPEEALEERFKHAIRVELASGRLMISTILTVNT